MDKFDDILGKVQRVGRDLSTAEQTFAVDNTSGPRTYWALAYDASSVDRHGTSMTPTAFQPSADAMEFPILLFHESDRFPVGKPVAIKYEANGLHVGFQFASTPEAKVAEQLVADGFLRGVSVGFIPQAAEMGVDADGDPIIIFTKADLLELSITPTPSSKKALIDLTRSIGGEDEIDIDAILDMFDADGDEISDEEIEELAAEADAEDACCADECTCEVERNARLEAINVLRAQGVSEELLAQLVTVEEPTVEEIEKTAATVTDSRERALRNLSLLRRFSR